MKTLTINIPDSLDISQERQFIAEIWYKSGKITAAQAAHITGSTIGAFLALAEPQTQPDRFIQQMARPIPESFNLDAIKRQKNYQGLNWQHLDHLAEQLNLDESIDDLSVQIGK